MEAVVYCREDEKGRNGLPDADEAKISNLLNEENLLNDIMYLLRNSHFLIICKNDYNNLTGA